VSWIQIEKRKVSLWEYGLFALGISEEQLSSVTQQELIDLCKREQALFIQLETLDFSGHHSGDIFTPGYYKKFITPYTAVINLEQTEGEILAAMKPKGRYNIRVAQKKAVTCKLVEKTDENIKAFHDIMNETTSRDKFSGHSFEYFKTFLDTLTSSEIILAYHEDEVIAGGIFIFDTELSIYYYGASGNKHRNLMAPYLIQWTAIEHAKQKWSKLYDFLGVATPGNDNDPLAWVTSFKKKLTKDVREVSKSYIYVNKKFKYNLIKFLKSFT